MGLTTKLAMAMVTSAAGAAMLAGGTFAYFSHQTTTAGHFAAGHVNMTVDVNSPGSGAFTLQNLEPGNKFSEKYTITNTGSLPFSGLEVSGTYTDGGPYLAGNDFGSQLEITGYSVDASPTVQSIPGGAEIPLPAQECG